VTDASIAVFRRCSWLGEDAASIEPRLLLAGPRLAYNSYGPGRTSVTLGGYARLDLIARYKINDIFTAFVRAENLTNTNYEVVYNYGTPGVSVYAGLTAKF
jgi:vitamin B12 transporter